MPLSASGTEKRQFQPVKNLGQCFLMSSLDRAAIAPTRPFLYFRLENKYCAKFTRAFRLLIVIFNAQRMRTRVTVLTLCVCLSGVCWCHKTVIQHGEHKNKLFAKFTTFSIHGFL